MTLNDDDLRRVLDREAAGVEFAPDALGEIRRRIEARRIRWWFNPRSGPRPLGGAMLAISTGAAVAATVVATVVGLGSCSPRPTTTTTHTPASTQSSHPTTGATTDTAAVSITVPVYYIGSVGGDDRLYREFHHLTLADTTTARVKAGLVEMLDGRTARDHDYYSQWPASTSIRNVTYAGGTATVDLAGATVNADDPAGNRAAIQQLIWTATAVPGVSGVRLLFDGKARATVWKSKQSVGGVLNRAPAVDTLAPVWVIDPQAGATSGTNVTVNLAGIVFEGTIAVRIKDSAGHVVKQQTVQLTVGAPAQGTGTSQFTLQPGTYTVEAYFVSLKDSSIQALDGHQFTVK